MPYELELIRRYGAGHGSRLRGRWRRGTGFLQFAGPALLEHIGSPLRQRQHRLLKGLAGQPWAEQLGKVAANGLYVIAPMLAESGLHRNGRPATLEL